MTERILCKLCPENTTGFANFPVHVRKKHLMSIEDYNSINETEFNEVMDEVAKYKPSKDFIEEKPSMENRISITEEERKKALFDNVIRKKPDRPLNDFCKEFEISETELINLVKKYKGEAEIPVLEQIENKEKLALKNAEKQAQNMPKVIRTFDAFEAQNLREKFNYRHVETIGRKGVTPKTYVLELNN